MAVQNEKELRYVIVELVGEKGTANSIEKGLFKGIKKEVLGAANFLWLKTGNNVVKACNLGFFNILSIETYDGDVKAFTFFMAGEEEQKKAYKEIDSIVSRLSHMLNNEDPQLIDVEKFTDLPSSFGSHNNSKINTNPSNAMVTGAANYNADLYNKDFSYEKKDPEPFSFKRDTKKPTKAALMRMKEKLDLIAKGEYKYELPEMSIEKVGAEEASV